MSAYSTHTPAALTAAIMARRPCESSGWTEERILALAEAAPNFNDQTLIDAAGQNGQWLIERLSLSGRFRAWHANGKLELDCTHENGQRHGRCREWYDNGQLRLDCHYENGQLSGRFRAWHDNGKLWRDCTYENGQWHGRFRDWHDNGKLWMDCTYEHGVIVREAQP